MTAGDGGEGVEVRESKRLREVSNSQQSAFSAGTSNNNMAFDSVVPKEKMSKLGFVGVGVMNGAIIRGICKLMGKEHALHLSLQDKSHNFKKFFDFPLYVSPRSADKVAALVKEFGADKIKVCASNQEVIDASTIVFVGLRPLQVRPVWEDEKLKVDPAKHFIVNITSTVKNKDMASIMDSGILLKAMDKQESGEIESKPDSVQGSTSGLSFFPLARVVKAVPIPPVQHLVGTTAVCFPSFEDDSSKPLANGHLPKISLGNRNANGTGSSEAEAALVTKEVLDFQDNILDLFSQLGYALKIPEDKLTTFQVISGMMGIFYQRCHLMQKWLVQHGVPDAVAHEYLTNFHRSIVEDCRDESFMELMEGQTKGGINRQGMEVLAEAEKTKLKEAMDGIFERLNKG